MADDTLYDLLDTAVSPANDEETIRTYFCTYYRSRLIGLEAEGYLGVTNKRVIFHANGSSAGSNSVIQSEVPIADISGIASFKGTYFSIWHALGAFFVSALISIVVSTLVNYLGWQAGYDTFQVVGWIVAIAALAGSFALKSQVIWRSVLAAVSVSVVASLGVSRFTNSFMSNLFSGGSGMGPELVVGFLVGLYTLLCFFWYARRPTFSLSISSKGGSSTPISISGATGLGIFNISAAALAAEPAKDSEVVLQELGALVLDVQMLGELGIKKWRGRK